MVAVVVVLTINQLIALKMKDSVGTQRCWSPSNRQKLPVGSLKVWCLDHEEGRVYPARVFCCHKPGQHGGNDRTMEQSAIISHMVEKQMSVFIFGTIMGTNCCLSHLDQ